MMSRSPFDLSFDELAAASAAASTAAVEEAQQAGVEVAALEALPGKDEPADHRLGGSTERGSTQHHGRWRTKVESLYAVGTLAAGQSEQDPVDVGNMGLSTTLTLGAHMCKWPIGDPSSAGFAFCGKAVAEGPYCRQHAALAYGPTRIRTNVRHTSVVAFAPWRQRRV